MRNRIEPKPGERLRIFNPNKLTINKQKMKAIQLTTQNGASITVAQDAGDGKLHILDGKQITKEILPDGVYQSEGLTFAVKDGKQTKSIFSMKKGIQPRASKIPVKAIHKEMQAKQAERKKEISEGRLKGKF